MAAPESSPRAAPAAPPRPQIIVVTTAMLVFISFWRAAAIVLCDMASTVYYIGGIVEQAIGKAAPWYIGAVMLFAYAVRGVYIESCAMFVRGGVYRVVKEAMGGTLAKLSVSALMFDYVLTGPISGVSAGQYIVGLTNELLNLLHLPVAIPTAAGSAAIAIAITLYFWRQNILGIEESSDKAMKIMGVTTVMVVVMVTWCGVTLWMRGATLPPFELHFSDEALGWLGGTGWEKKIGALGILIAFGHSILAMSGEESLAQVNREIAHPKVPNLIKAGLIIFVFTMLTTGLVSFFAVMIIPDDVRMSTYSDNLVGGLAMYMVGPLSVRLVLRAFVVVVGFLILAGAVNTAIVGSNGVLNRVAEDGVLADWFRLPHRRYGTTHRIIDLVVGLQIFTIVASRGNVYALGEAYAFGVVWSFVFKALSMVMLRFKDRRPRAWRVPLNVRVGRWELPVGLALIFLVLLATALEGGHRVGCGLHDRVLRDLLAVGAHPPSSRRRPPAPREVQRSLHAGAGGGDARREAGMQGRPGARPEEPAPPGSRAPRGRTRGRGHRRADGEGRARAGGDGEQPQLHARRAGDLHRGRQPGREARQERRPARADVERCLLRGRADGA